MSKEVSFQIIHLEKTENNFFQKGFWFFFYFSIGILGVFACIDKLGVFESSPQLFLTLSINTLLTLLALLFLFLIGVFSTSWKGNKMVKIGQLDIDQDEAYIKINGEKNVLQNIEYGISFLDEGYDGKNNYQPLVLGSHTSDISNGINTIAFINKKHEHPIIEFQIYVENYRKMDTLLEIVAKVNSNKN